jgi:hypothetical protein
VRPGEIISVVAFFCFIVLGWLLRVERRKQHRLIILGVLGTAAVLAVRALSRPYPATAHVIGDWLPSILILIVYWQSGCFSQSINSRLQTWLECFDRRWIGSFLGRWEQGFGNGWVGTYFEVAYLFCYMLIPLGIAALYIANQRAAVDTYWATVLPATFFCYLVIPFASALPPRLMREQNCRRSKVQSLNLFILRHASIQLNTFPSAHVACSVAGSLVLLWAVPPVGVVFLFVSLCIAAGAVLGRYHYLPDVVLGILLPIAIAIATIR